MDTPNYSNHRLIPLTQWNEFHVWPTIPNLRYYVQNQDTNGMREQGVVKRVGKRVLIDEPAFFRWVEAQQGEKPANGAQV